MATPPKSLYGLLGHPLGHSLSPAMFAAILPAVVEGGAYVPFDVPPDRLDAFLEGAELLGVGGFNVTIPYKTRVLDFATEVDGDVAAIGASNCLVRRGSGWVARNTDAEAFRRTLLAAVPAPGRSLVLGTGGAARAVVHVLRGAGADSIVVATRRPQRGLDPWFAGCTVVALADAGAAAAAADVVVNATPTGTWPRTDETPLSSGFRPGQVVYDLVYNPRPSRLLRLAVEGGARPLDGMEMLARQAAESLRHFTGAVVAWQKFQVAAERELRRRGSGSV
jgi:shikimate dehydrogenase